MTGGGTVCIFRIGRPGTSARHLRYIARAEAVREKEQDVMLHGVPDSLGITAASDYARFTRLLARYASELEKEEIARHTARGLPRTHYRVTFSFERDLESEQVKVLLTSWLEIAFPNTRSVTFLHRNTAHLHAHGWIAARQTDGKKVNLSARAFRQMDELWNRLYTQALGLEEREHLLKKQETEDYKRLRREGREARLPERAAQHWHPGQFTQKEREHLEGMYERDQGRTGADQSKVARSHTHPKGRQPSTEREKRRTGREAEGLLRAYREAERAVHEIGELRETLARLAERNRELDRER